VTFWRQHLQGARSLDLRAGRPLPARRTFDAGVEEFTVQEELQGRLEAFAAEHCVTLFMTLFTAFNALLHAETGADDIVVICLFANRDQVEIENLIGNFYAGLPLRSRLSGARTFRELLEHVRDVTLAAHEHPDILYEPVFEGMNFDNQGPGGLDTFRILFQLAKLPPAGQALSDLTLTRLPFGSDKMRKDLSLFMAHSDRIAGFLRYNRDLIDPESAVRMREGFLAILAAIVDDPDRPLVELLPAVGKKTG
jgi:non-ribosomal peptide synthetase component F